MNKNKKDKDNMKTRQGQGLWRLGRGGVRAAGCDARTRDACRGSKPDVGLKLIWQKPKRFQR